MRLILHAGTHKTGTTSIQHYAYENHAMLLDRGLYYLLGESKLGGSSKIWRSNNWLAQGLTGAYHENEEVIEAALLNARKHAELGASVLISSEDLSSCCQGHILWGGLDRADYRALQNMYLQRLATLLKEFEVEVFLVFRRADEYAESLYQTVTKSNRFAGTFEEFLSYFAPLFEYGNQLHAFRSVFPRVRCLPYHELGPNLVEGFMQEIGFLVDNSDDHRLNTAVDARLIFWKANRDAACENAPTERDRHRDFIISNRAKSLFSDAGEASFWRNKEERVAFHEMASADFSELSFPEAKERPTSDARLGKDALRAVSAEFDAWSAAQKNGWSARALRKLRNGGRRLLRQWA